MAKPWAKLEQNYINHPKFLGLSAGAICLWHEGKNYCDLHMTDGLIPREALRTFRFMSRNRMEELLKSAGEKASGDGIYAPLWEPHADTGHFKMHDYLDHNDCREEVLDRISDADKRNDMRRLKNRERQSAWRKRTQVSLATGVLQPSGQRDSVDYTAILERDGSRCHICKKTVAPSDVEFDHIVPIASGGAHSEDNIAVSHKRCNRVKGHRDSNVYVTRDTLPPTETATETETTTVLKRREETRASRPATVFDGSLPRDHRAHVFCDDSFSLCVAPQVHAKLLNALARRYDGDRHRTHTVLKDWYPRAVAGLPAETVMGDGFKFWQVLFDAEFVTTPTVTPAAPDYRAQDEGVLKILKQQGVIQ